MTRTALLAYVAIMPNVAVADAIELARPHPVPRHHHVQAKIREALKDIFFGPTWGEQPIVDPGVR